MNRRYGFTLIEILVVIGIVALLASVILVGLSPARQRGRDARRIADMSQMQNALELYFSRCGYYPSSDPPDSATLPGCKTDGNNLKVDGTVTMTGASASGNENWGSLSKALINAGLANRVPDDPLAPGRRYVYFAASSTPSTYIMATVLEGSAADLSNDLDDDNIPGALSDGINLLQKEVNGVQDKDAYGNNIGGCDDPGNYCVGVL